MTEQLPEPLVPPDLDVRALDGFLYNVDKMMASELWALSTGDEFKAANGLWCRAWKQVPAASLPNDQRILASFSGAGAKWPKVRAMAMRGWVLCSDGRWYHPVLAADAIRAAKARRQRQDAIASRYKKDRGEGSETELRTNRHPNDARTTSRSGSRSTAEPTAVDTNQLRNSYQGEERRGEEEVRNSSLRSESSSTPELALGSLDPPAPERDEAREAFEAYNTLAAKAGLPQAAILSRDRLASIKARLAECGGIEGWHAALAKLEASPHCRGENDRGWRADLDFLLQPKSFRRLMEGSYDDRRPNGSGAGAHRETPHETLTRSAAEALARRRDASRGGE